MTESPPLLHPYEFNYHKVALFRGRTGPANTGPSPRIAPIMHMIPATGAFPLSLLVQNPAVADPQRHFIQSFVPIPAPWGAQIVLVVDGLYPGPSHIPQGFPIPIHTAPVALRQHGLGFGMQTMSNAALANSHPSVRYATAGNDILLDHPESPPPPYRQDLEFPGRFSRGISIGSSNSASRPNRNNDYSTEDVATRTRHSQTLSTLDLLFREYCFWERDMVQGDPADDDRFSNWPKRRDWEEPFPRTLVLAECLEVRGPRNVMDRAAEVPRAFWTEAMDELPGGDRVRVEGKRSDDSLCR